MQNVAITFFVKDLKKQGGKYEAVAGRIKRIDDVGNIVVMEDGTEINMTNIIEIDILKDL